MKKENIFKYLYVISTLLIIGCFILIGIDWYNYGVEDSAPFSAFIIVRIIEFIIPSIIIAIIARIMKKKYNK